MGLLEESEALEKLASLGETWTVQEIDYRGCETEIGEKAMSKTMSVRMDRDNYDFLTSVRAMAMRLLYSVEIPPTRRKGFV